MSVRELEELINRHLDGITSPEEAAQLSIEIERDPAACALHLKLARLHADLSVAKEMESAPLVFQTGPNTCTASDRTAALGEFDKPWMKLAAVLVLALAVAAVWKILLPTESERIAKVDRVVGVQFVEGRAIQVGQELSPGRLALSGGAMSMTLRNGVVILFEGPGELELITPMRTVLHSGQAVVRVPENAIGFQLETPGANIEDLGTEFAVKAGPGLITDVQVYEGEVITAPKGSASAGGFPRRLMAGHALRFQTNTDQSPQQLAYSADRFIRRLPVDAPIELQENIDPLFNATTVGELVLSQPEKPVIVDGDLTEWSDAGSFRAERKQVDLPGQFVEGRMRYDKTYLYIAAHVDDPFPLRNVIDPAIDGESGWRGGGLQVRLSTDRTLGWPVDANAPVYYKFRRLQPDAAHLANVTSDELAHLTMWHSAPSRQDCLYIDYGMDFRGGIVNPPGYQAAFKEDADGRGYSLEYAVPWSLLNVEGEPPRTGDTLAVSWTVHWSDESGRLWRGQLVEVRNASEPLRIHTWERAATWGRAVYR